MPGQLKPLQNSLLEKKHLEEGGALEFHLIFEMTRQVVGFILDRRPSKGCGNWKICTAVM